MLDGSLPVNMDFSFRPRHYKIDWKKIASIDFDTFDAERNLIQLQEYLMSITFCDIENEIKPTNVNTNLIKLFKLAQYLLEYMMFSQNQLAQKLFKIEKGMTKNDKNYNSHKSHYLLTKEKLDFAKNEIKKLNKTLKSYKEIIFICSINNWNIKDLIHQCPYCVKAFITNKYLISHMERRHDHSFKPELVSKVNEKVSTTQPTHNHTHRQTRFSPAAKESRQKDHKDHIIKAKHYTKRKSIPHNRYVHEQKESLSTDESLIILPVEVKDQPKPPKNGRNEAFEAFTSLCHSQELKYIDEMKGFKECLDTHMKDVADQIIDLVKDRITSIPKKDSIKAHEDSSLAGTLGETPPLTKHKSASLPVVQTKHHRNNLSLQKNHSQSKKHRNSIKAPLVIQKPPPIHDGQEDKIDAQVQELEKTFEKRLQEQEIKWQQRLEKMESMYSKRMSKEDTQLQPETKKVIKSSKFLVPVAEHPKAKLNLKEADTQILFVSPKASNPLKHSSTPISSPKVVSQTSTDAIPSLLKRCANVVLPPNDTTNSLKVKIERSLDKEMEKYGLNTKSSQLTQSSYDSAVKDLKGKENGILQVYPNYVNIKRHVIDILNAKVPLIENTVLKSASNKAELKQIEYVVPINSKEEETGSTYDISSNSSPNSSDGQKDAYNVRKTKNTPTAKKPSLQSDTSEEKIPTRDVANVPVLIHHTPSQSQKSLSSESEDYESSESQVSYDDFLTNTSLPNPMVKAADMPNRRKVTG